MQTNYCLSLSKGQKKLSLALTANDVGHAQAQASDISRAFGADTLSLTYEEVQENTLSQLLGRLAVNDFSHKKCDYWEGSFVNEHPVLYALGKRYYIRPLILDYLDIHKDGAVKPCCGNKKCINPLHNTYKSMKASKLSGADITLALAFHRDGAPVREIARALKVHRSTIYRILKNERLSSGSKDYRHSPSR